MDEFKRRASFEEGCEVLDRDDGPRRDIEPREGGKAETAKVHANVMQFQTCEFWELACKNGTVKFHIPIGDIGIVGDCEIL